MVSTRSRCRCSIRSPARPTPRCASAWLPSTLRATKWFALAGDPRDNYVPRMDWAGNGEVLIQYENRRQNTNRVLLGDAATGAARPS